VLKGIETDILPDGDLDLPPTSSRASTSSSAASTPP
jgi:hypothetical protein